MALTSYLLSTLALTAAQAPQGDKPFDLMVGDPAPALRRRRLTALWRGSGRGLAAFS
jgi:hypothetical protein